MDLFIGIKDSNTKKIVNMNICCLSIVTYWHGIKGGLEVHGKLLCERLVEMGHNVTIISTNHPEKQSLKKEKA